MSDRVDYNDELTVTVMVMPMLEMLGLVCLSSLDIILVHYTTNPKITRLKVPPEQRRRAGRATVQKEKAEKAFNSLVNDDEFVTVNAIHQSTSTMSAIPSKVFLPIRIGFFK